MTDVIHQPHDKFFKKAMGDIRIARQFFAVHLPVKLKDKIDLQTLEQENQSFIDDAFKSSEADLVYSVNIGNSNTAYIYLLCENQSTIEHDIALRLLGYKLGIINFHRQQQLS